MAQLFLCSESVASSCIGAGTLLEASPGPCRHGYTYSAAMNSHNQNPSCPNVCKPVDNEFWSFLNDPRNLQFLRQAIRSKLSSGSLEDPDDIITRIKVKYSGEGKFRPAKLDDVTLKMLAKRQVLDYVREGQVKKRGGGVQIISMDLLDCYEWLSEVSMEPVELGPSRSNEVLSAILSRAQEILTGKQLMVVEALLCWLEEGCPTESWYEKLSPQAVEEFLALKKGKSLEGKVSATFTKVKKTLREIIVREGLLEN